MITHIESILGSMNSLVWGFPLMALLVGTGIYLTVRMGGIQIRGFFHAISIVKGTYDNPDDPGEINHFKALATALSATIGTGNIVGVATAILIGGPGAVFWMWVTALVGMATKYACCTLAVRFRRVDEAGEVHGGPMHYIEQGMGPRFKWLAVLFASFTICATMGIGNMFQSNSVAMALDALFYGYDRTPPLYVNIVIGIVLAVVVGMVIIGGIKRIAKFAAMVVPFMCLFYLLGGLLILFANMHLILPGLKQIFTMAFSAPESVSGGLFGGVIRAGVARGLFSNEAGMGSAAIAHGAAKTNEPVREGLVAMLEPFIDTIVVCSITALVIVCTGAASHTNISGRLTSTAFELGLPGTGWLVSVGIILFAFSTLVSWCYYGDRSIDYLFGSHAHRAVLVYRLVYVVFVFLGAVVNFPIIITFCDTMNGLMAVPNLIALVVLSPLVVRLTRDYFQKMNRK